AGGPEPLPAPLHGQPAPREPRRHLRRRPDEASHRGRTARAGRPHSAGRAGGTGGRGGGRRLGGGGVVGGGGAGRGGGGARVGRRGQHRGLAGQRGGGARDRVVHGGQRAEPVRRQVGDLGPVVDAAADLGGERVGQGQ